MHKFHRKNKKQKKTCLTPLGIYYIYKGYRTRILPSLIIYYKDLYAAPLGKHVSQLFICLQSNSKLLHQCMWAVVVLGHTASNEKHWSANLAHCNATAAPTASSHCGGPGGRAYCRIARSPTVLWQHGPMARLSYRSSEAYRPSVLSMSWLTCTYLYIATGPIAITACLMDWPL